MMQKKLLLYLFIAFSQAAFAQVDYLDKQPGVFHQAKPASVAGFPSYEIYQVFNKIPFINHPVGFDTKEGTSIQLDKQFNVYTGYLMLGFPRYWRLGDKIELQGEYYNINIICNTFKSLVRESILDQDADILHFPQFISDTTPFQYRMINGALVGEGQARPQYWQSRDIFMLNPKQKPCFVPVTTEEYIRFLTQKLTHDIEEDAKSIDNYEKLLVQMRAETPQPKDLPSNERGQTVARNRLDLYKRKLKEYQDKAAHLSEKEKKEPVTVMYPEMILTMDKKGNPITPLTGYLPYEIYTPEAKVSKVMKLFHYNMDFFDPKLPKTAVQLMLFFYLNGYEKRDPFETRIRNEVFPSVDFKALQGLMYR
jgi:hypothetical protein